LHQLGDLFKLNVKLRCQKVKKRSSSLAFFSASLRKCATKSQKISVGTYIAVRVVLEAPHLRTAKGAVNILLDAVTHITCCFSRNRYSLCISR